MIEILLTIAGIVAPSILITLAVRRWYDEVSPGIAALLLLIVLASLNAAVFTRDMPVVLTEVMRGYPYRGLIGPVKSKNPDTNDTVKQMLPWMKVAREELFARRAPLWNRYSFSGYPLLGNGQSAPFSPFFLLTLFVPLPKQIVAMAGLKLFVGLLFGFLFARREGLSIPAALFGSIVFAFSVFQNVYLYYPLSSVTFLLPAAAYAVLRCLDQPNWPRFWLVAIVVGSLMAAGHPESVVHVALAVCGLVLIERFAPVQPLPGFARRFGVAFAGAISGLVISLPAWLPILQQILASQRMSVIDAGRFGSPRYPWEAWWVFFNPDWFGNPAHGNWNWIMHYIMVAVSYLGLLPLALALSALIPGRAARRDVLLGAFAIVTMLIAMRWTILGEVYNRLPVAEWVANDRFRFVTIFLVGVVAARGSERLRNGRWAWELVVSAAVAVLATWAFVKRFGITLTWASIAGVGALILFWLAFASVRLWRKTTLASIPLAAALVTLSELLVFNFGFNAMTPRGHYIPKLPIIERIHAAALQEPFRVLGHDWVFLPNASGQYGLEDVRGSDPMAWRPYIDFFRLIQVKGQSTDVGRVQDVVHPAVSFLNVRFLLAEPESEFGDPWRRIYRGRDGDLYENTKPVPRFFSPRRLEVMTREQMALRLASITDLSETALIEQGTGGENPQIKSMWLRQMSPRRFRMTVDAWGRSFVASSQPAAPGWVVKINGREAPIHRVNGAFLGFFVPLGKSKVVVEYRPGSFYGSLAVAVVAAILLLGVMWRRTNSSSFSSGYTPLMRFQKIVALSLLISAPVAAQDTLPTSTKAGIEKAATDILAKTGSPSASIAVVTNGKLAYVRAYGLATIETKTPAAPPMRYAIGSVTKQFTAAAVLLLAEEGKLSLDDKIVRWLPELTRAREVTVRQLLSMTSGYQDYWPQDYVMSPMLQVTTPHEIVDRWARIPLDFEPGTKWQYSNTNYVIAGMIVEKASGMPLSDFLQKRIFGPLQMTSVVHKETLGSGDPARYETYALGSPRPAPLEGKGWLFAAGDLAMTATDLAKWDMSLIDQTVLDAASYREMLTETRLRNGVGTGYGLGVALDLVNGRRRVSHDGIVSGFTAKNVVYPDERTAVVVLTSVTATSAAEQIATEIGELLFAPAPNQSALEQTRNIFVGLQKGQIDRTLFTPNGNAYFSDAVLKDFASSLQPLGRPKELTQKKQGLRGGMTLREYRAVFPKKTLRIWTFTLPDGKLEQYMIAVAE